MATLERRPFVLTLKQTLLADAALSGAVGLLSVGAAGWLASSLDLPSALLAGSGAIMLVYAAALMLLARREPIPANGAHAVIGGNVAWAVACAVLLFGTWIDPNAGGIAFILMQIVAVLAFAELQAMALRASR